MRTILAGVSFERISALDGNDLAAYPDYSEPFADAYQGLTRYERACIDSHYKAWCRFLATDDQRACFLEDDVVLAPEFGEFLTDPGWEMTGCGILKLETIGVKIPFAPKVTPFRRRTIRYALDLNAGAAGYVLTRDTAEKLVAHGARLDCPIDIFLFRVPFTIPGVVIGQLDPALCIQIRLHKSSGLTEELTTSIQMARRRKASLPNHLKIFREIARPFRQFAAIARRAAQQARRQTVVRSIPFE